MIKSEDEVLDAQSLPKIKMPNRNGYPDHPEWKHGDAAASQLSLAS